MSYTDTNPAPNYHLKINGATMGPKFMKLVTGAQFDDEASLISSLSFSLRYRELFQGGVAENILNSPIIAPGNLVVLRGGYGTDLVDIGAGYITEIEPDFAENDEPVINFKCYDQLHRASMAKHEQGENFKGQRDSAIISKIGYRNGFYITSSDKSTYRGIHKINEISKKPRMQKRGMSDLAWMLEIAKQNSFDLYCKWDEKVQRFVLYFQPYRESAKPFAHYRYGDPSFPWSPTNKEGEEIQARLLSFKPSLSLVNQFTKYKVYSRDSKTNKTISHTLTLDYFMRRQSDIKATANNLDSRFTEYARTSGPGMRRKAFGDNTEVIAKKTFPDSSEAKRELYNHMKRVARDFIVGNARVGGFNRLQSRQIIKCSGMGALFDGNYFLNKVSHIFNNDGYTCNATARVTAKELGL